MKDFSELERKLNIRFINKDLLVQAFCHRSYLNEHPDFPFSHNERLEFLGDAVLELVVTEYLFKSYSEEGEGILTAWRSALVNANRLSELAKKLYFEDFLLLSKGEEKEKGRGRLYILANTFEAFLGALYLDQGYEVCYNFVVENLVFPYLPIIIEKGLFKDAKSQFQEEAQERLGITPTYRVLKEWGPDHDKKFLVGVFLKDELIATGEGPSKQEAEIEAAKNALEIKNWQ
jgi:ribonuclease-3